MLYNDVNMINPTETPAASNVDSIYQSIVNIMSTVPGERLFNPGFGMRLQDSLFTLFTPSTRLTVFKEVIDSISEFEPRVDVDSGATEVYANPTSYRYDLTLVFSLIEDGNKIYKLEGALSD